MSDARLHHYVPRFYLARFRDASGNLHVWDREQDRVFRTGPRALAAEQGFYFLDEYAAQGLDGVAMERQFAELESEVAIITGQWIDWIRAGALGMDVPIPRPNREIISLFIALQFLRTRDARDVLVAFASEHGEDLTSDVDQRALHTALLWDGRLVQDLRDRILSSTWVFGRNTTRLPFVTSDNPVAFRSTDNSTWLKVGFFSPGTYAVYPLAPDVVMYCHPREEPWLKLIPFDACVSPVEFTEELVDSENSAQVFMASRFVISNVDDFDAAREFAATVGTDKYAPYWRDRRGS